MTTTLRLARRSLTAGPPSLAYLSPLRVRTIMSHTDPDCIFCKIIAGKIPSFKLVDTDKSYAFLDIGPISRGHCLVISKYHAAKMHELPDDSLSDLLPVAKKLALAVNAEDYNILNNNGAPAHQVVPHVHFHFIPKPNEKEGLVIGWPATQPDKKELAEYAESLKDKLAKL